jgi:hypothetical protein
MGVALLLMTHATYAITISYTYDELGRLTNAAYSNNNFISYTYDSVGNITDTQPVALQMQTMMALTTALIIALQPVMRTNLILISISEPSIYQRTT